MRKVSVTSPEPKRGGSFPLWRFGLLVPAVVLTCAGLTFGQATEQKAEKKSPNDSEKKSSVEPTKKAPATLEELLAQALKANPDIRVAEAKLREAEAELNRTRLQ